MSCYQRFANGNTYIFVWLDLMDYILWVNDNNRSPLNLFFFGENAGGPISEMSTIMPIRFLVFTVWAHLLNNDKMSSYFSRMTSYHPYQPVDINLSGKYIENSFSPSILIIAFTTTWALVLGATLFAVRRFYPRLSIKDQGLILWFILSKSGMRI